jgi:hypothetical protein
MQRRSESEAGAGDERDRKRKQEHRRIEPGLVQPWNGAGIERGDDRKAPVRQQHAGAAAERGEQQALGQHLANQPCSARAEQGPDNDFLLPARRARQQEIRDVRARDEQDEADGREQNRQRRPERRDEVVLQAKELDPARRFRGRRERVRLGRRLLERHAVPQASDRLDQNDLASARHPSGRREHEWRPE